MVTMVRECLSRLYIGHLPAETMEDDLRVFLLNGGKLSRNSFNITVKKGYAFMQCCDQATADQVIDLFHGSTYQGNTLCIEPAVSNFAGANTKHGRCLVRFSRFSDEANNNETVASIQDLERVLALWGGSVLSLEKFSSSSFIVVVADRQTEDELISALNGVAYGGLKVKASASPELMKATTGLLGGGDASSVSIRRKPEEQAELPSSSTGEISPEGSGYRPHRYANTSRSPFDGRGHGSNPRGFGPAFFRGNGNPRWNDNYNSHPHFPWRMLVPAAQVGALIGRSGATIRGITLSTGARINIHTGHAGARNPNQDAEKVLSIVGSPSNITAACREILKVLAQDLSKSFGAELALRIMAFDSLIGRIIGKGGSNITKVMQESNTRIHISNLQDNARYLLKHGDCDRIITIRGSIGGMSAAESMLSAKLRSSYESDQHLQPKDQFPPVGYFHYQH